MAVYADEVSAFQFADCSAAGLRGLGVRCREYHYSRTSVVIGCSSGRIHPYTFVVRQLSAQFTCNTPKAASGGLVRDCVASAEGLGRGCPGRRPRRCSPGTPPNSRLPLVRSCWRRSHRTWVICLRRTNKEVARIAERRGPFMISPPLRSLPPPTPSSSTLSPLSPTSSTIPSI